MNEIDEAVNDIIAQLKQHNTSIKQVKDTDLSKEGVEEFLINQTAKLVNTSLNMIENVNMYIASSPEHKDITAYAELIKASSQAIDVLNKLHVAKEKNESQKELKKMDIESRERLNYADNQTKLLLTRDDIYNVLFNEDEDKMIDI